MATRRDRRAARAKPSPAALSRDLAASRARILGLEDRLSAAYEKVFNQAGKMAARKFNEKATHAVTAAAPSPEGTMVAVYPTPEQAAALAQEGGEPAEILHVTLAYLGKTTPEEADAALGPVREVAASQPAAPLEGQVVGVSTFNPSEDDAGEPLYPSIALPDAPGLAELRAAVCEALDAAGIWYSTDHVWTPHITISYQPEAIPPPRELIGQPLTFGALTLSRGDVPTHLPLGPGALTAAVPPWVPPAADEVVDVPAIVSQLHTKADPIRRSAIREYGAALDGIANWDVTNPLAAGVLAGAGQHVTAIADTTRLNVMRTISASYDQGLTVDETAKAIQAGMRAASPARARLIARTELAAVANGGSLAATQIFADATGDTLYKRWLTAPGAEHPRHEDYEGLDGQTVALSDAFDVGGFQLQFPGDPDGPPEEVCNCRCALIYVGSPNEETGPAGYGPEGYVPPTPVDDPLSTVADVAEAVPTAEAGIEAANSDEMSVVLSGDAIYTQAQLRAGTLDAALTADLKKVDTAIGGAVLDKGAVTLRGLSDLKPMFDTWPPKVGDIAYDPAYASTTVDEKVAARFAGKTPDSGYVTYHSAPGQNGLWIPGIAPMDESESELLLPRGLPLRVIGVGKRDGLPDVHVEIVGRGVTPGLADYGNLAEIPLDPPTGASPYSYAGPILRNAARSEAEVTAALTDIVARQGGSFEGLPFRMKSAPSVARKIETTMRDKEVPLAAAASGVKDSLRYTAIFEPGEYVPKVNAVLDELKAKAGIVPERISATWERDVPYVGTNVVMRAPNGLRFELQFHTPQSFDVKEHLNHPLYQRQRRLAVDSPEWKALGQEMLGSANGVERPPGILEWKYQTSVEADIGITPFRAGTDDPFGFYDRARFKTFEAHAEKIASSYGVTIDAKLKVPSVWEGVEEPGVSIHAHDGEKGVAAFAADLGKVYDQQGVLLFTPTLGDDLIATFDAFPPDVGRDWVLGAMERAGLPGGRFLEDGRLQIIGSGPAFVSQLDAVARDLGGVGYDSALGRFSLLEKANGDYEAALRDFASAEGQQVRAPGAALEEHGGTPPLGPGAPGSQGAAPKVVAGLGPAPLPHIPHWSAAEVKAMTDDELWGALAIDGKIENIARVDVTAAEDRRLRAEIWRRASAEKTYPPALPLSSSVSGRYFESLSPLLEAYPDDPALIEIGSALSSAGIDGSRVWVAENAAADKPLEARLLGAINYTVKPDRVVVNHLGSRGGGAGTRLMAEAAREAVKANVPIVLEAAPGSEGFYRKLGFVSTTKPEMQLSGPALKRLAEGPYPVEGALRFGEIAGDNQLHTTFSDGHGTIREMALVAIKRGQTQMVVSDHGHLMTSADVARQHRQIDKLNREFAGKFKILKGVETNIDENGYLDVAPDALAKFDTVNAAIHGTEALGPQQIIFPHTPTERLLNALNSPYLDVLVHPHAVTADWDAVAKKAAERHVALEVNGRSLLRQDSADQAALMIAAAKKYGAKLAIGSDAHNAGDIVDLVYASRFAAEHGVTAQDLVGIQQRGGLAGLVDPSTTLPGDREITLGKMGSHRLGGGMNVVWKVERGDQTLVVKPKPDPERLRELGMDTENPIRENVEPGLDLERERAAYVVSRYFNEAGGDDFHVNVPPYRISKIIQPNALDRAETPAGVATFIPGETAMEMPGYWQDEVSDADLRPAGLFDTIIGNTDRHRGNFIFGDDGNLWLIDHGLAFPNGPGDAYSENADLSDLARYRFKDRLTPRELSFLGRFRDLWPQMEAELQDSGIGPKEILDLKERLDYMIQTKERLSGSGGDANGG